YGSSTAGGPNFNPGNTVMVVTRISNNQLDLWVNPSSATATPQLTHNKGWSTFEGIGLTSTNASDRPFLMDRIVVGETFQSVVSPTGDPQPGNLPPSVSISSPSNNAIFTSGSNVTISATASDSDGSVSKVEFYQGSTKLGEDTSSPYSYTWSGVPAGSYSLTARSIDNQGAIGTSSEVAITVSSPSGPRDAFSTIQVESFDSQSGIQTNSVGIGYFDAGDWIRYNNVDFGSGAASVEVNIAVDNNYAGDQIEFRLGSTTGTLVGTLTVAGTGGWNAYQVQTATITGASGTHNLYLVGAGGEGIGNVDWFRFVAGGASNTAPSVSISSPSNNATFTSGSNITITPRPAIAMEVYRK
ncbi:MAG: carbohydrate-binding protein, partial [Cytophagales bacterium]|nr:carbohydrate-binding protein [Cytophagales bacterium]